MSDWLIIILSLITIYVWWLTFKVQALIKAVAVMKFDLDLTMRNVIHLLDKVINNKLDENKN